MLEFEPPDPEDEIFRLDNVITTGHIGAATTEALIRLRQSVARSIVDVLSGKRPKDIANPDVREGETGIGECAWERNRRILKRWRKWF